MNFPDHSAAGNQGQAKPKHLEDSTDDFNSTEGNEDQKRCLEDLERSLAGASMLVEGLGDAKKGKYHGRKLHQGKTDQDFVSQEETLVFV